MSELQLDDNFLVNYQDWTPAIAEQFAQEEGVELTEQSHVAIQLLREYYDQFKQAPMHKVLLARFSKQLGLEPKEGKALFYRLFPEGPASQAARIAGLPKPKRCCM